jgi:hypothetical protein
METNMPASSGQEGQSGPLEQYMMDDISLNNLGDQDLMQHCPSEVKVGPGGMEVSQEPDDIARFYSDWDLKKI